MNGRQRSVLKEGVVAGLIGAAVRSDPVTGSGAARLAELADEVAALVGRYPAYDRQEALT